VEGPARVREGTFAGGGAGAAAGGGALAEKEPVPEDARPVVSRGGVGAAAGRAGGQRRAHPRRRAARGAGGAARRYDDGAVVRPAHDDAPDHRVYAAAQLLARKVPRRARVTAARKANARAGGPARASVCQKTIQSPLFLVK